MSSILYVFFIIWSPPQATLSLSSHLFFSNYTTTPEIYTLSLLYSLFFFLNDPAPPEFSPLPLHAPLPIAPPRRAEPAVRARADPGVRAQRASAPDGPPGPPLGEPSREARRSPRREPADRVAPAPVQPERLTRPRARRHRTEHQAPVVAAEVVGALPQTDRDAAEVVGPDHGPQPPHADIAAHGLLERVVDAERPRPASHEPPVFPIVQHV